MSAIYPIYLPTRCSLRRLKSLPRQPVLATSSKLNILRLTPKQGRPDSLEGLEGYPRPHNGPDTRLASTAVNPEDPDGRSSSIAYNDLESTQDPDSIAYQKISSSLQQGPKPLTRPAVIRTSRPTSSYKSNNRPGIAKFSRLPSSNAHLRQHDPYTIVNYTSLHSYKKQPKERRPPPPKPYVYRPSQQTRGSIGQLRRKQKIARGELPELPDIHRLSPLLADDSAGDDNGDDTFESQQTRLEEHGEVVEYKTQNTSVNLFDTGPFQMSGAIRGKDQRSSNLALLKPLPPLPTVPDDHLLLAGETRERHRPLSPSPSHPRGVSSANTAFNPKTASDQHVHTLHTPPPAPPHIPSANTSPPRVPLRNPRRPSPPQTHSPYSRVPQAPIVPSPHYRQPTPPKSVVSKEVEDTSIDAAEQLLGLSSTTTSSRKSRHYGDDDREEPFSPLTIEDLAPLPAPINTTTAKSPSPRGSRPRPISYPGPRIRSNRDTPSEQSRPRPLSFPYYHPTSSSPPFASASSTLPSSSSSSSSSSYLPTHPTQVSEAASRSHQQAQAQPYAHLLPQQRQPPTPYRPGYETKNRLEQHQHQQSHQAPLAPPQTRNISLTTPKPIAHPQWPNLRGEGYRYPSTLTPTPNPSPNPSPNLAPATNCSHPPSPSHSLLTSSLTLPSSVAAEVVDVAAEVAASRSAVMSGAMQDVDLVEGLGFEDYGYGTGGDAGAADAGGGGRTGHKGGKKGFYYRDF